MKRFAAATVVAAAAVSAAKSVDITLEQEHANVEALIMGDKSLESVMNDAETSMEVDAAYAKVGQHVRDFHCF